MKILKRREVSAKIKEQVTQMMEGLEGPAPKLAIVRVGEKPDDMSYERGGCEEDGELRPAGPDICVPGTDKRQRFQG